MPPNASKGLWVRNGNKLIDGGKYLRVPGARDHDLVQLAAAVGFATSPLENGILRRLSKFTASQVATQYPKEPTTWCRIFMALLARSMSGNFSPQDFRISSSVINKIISDVSGKKRRVLPRSAFLPSSGRPAVKLQAAVATRLTSRADPQSDFRPFSPSGSSAQDVPPPA